MIQIKEFIIEYVDCCLDLYEYTKEKKLMPLEIHSNVCDIIGKICEYKDCFVWIEKIPMFNIIKDDLEKREIQCDSCYAAEQWLYEEWNLKRHHTKYIGFWQWIKPPTHQEQLKIQSHFRFEF